MSLIPMWGMLLILLESQDPLTGKQLFAQEVVQAVTGLESLAFVVDIEETAEHRQAGKTKRSLKARVLMADGRRYRVEVSEGGKAIAFIISDGQQVSEWEAKQNRWTRYRLPPLEEGACGRLLNNDFLTSRYAASWVDEREDWSSWVHGVITAPESQLAGPALVEGRKCREVRLKKTPVKEMMPPVQVTQTATILFDVASGLPRREVNDVQVKMLALVMQSTRQVFSYEQVRVDPQVSPDDFGFAPPAGSRFVAPEQLQAQSLCLDGQAAPDFTLPSTDGSTVSLSDYAGKPVLLVFWASWCLPCKWVLRDLRAVQTEFADQGFAVLAISIDSSEDALKKFLRRRPLEFPVLHDVHRKVAHGYYGGAGVPTEILIARDGVVVKTWRCGASPELINAIRREVENLLH